MSTYSQCRKVLWQGCCLRMMLLRMKIRSQSRHPHQATGRYRDPEHSLYPSWERGKDLIKSLGGREKVWRRRCLWDESLSEATEGGLLYSMWWLSAGQLVPYVYGALPHRATSTRLRGSPYPYSAGLGMPEAWYIQSLELLLVIKPAKSSIPHPPHVRTIVPSIIPHPHITIAFHGIS
jgi:hypothetical protein